MEGILEAVYINNAPPGSAKQWTRYDIKIGGVKYTSFDQNLGSRAMSLQGQNVEFSFTEATKNGYTNRNITAIQAFGGNGGVQPTQQTTQTEQQPRQPAKNIMEDNKDKRTAFMYACELVKARNAPKVAYSNDEIAKDVEDLAKKFLSILETLGNTPKENVKEVFNATETTGQEPLL